jgi:hypothetical protein
MIAINDPRAEKINLDRPRECRDVAPSLSPLPAGQYFHNKKRGPASPLGLQHTPLLSRGGRIQGMSLGGLTERSSISRVAAQAPSAGREQGYGAGIVAVRVESLTSFLNEQFVIPNDATQRERRPKLSSTEAAQEESSGASTAARRWTRGSPQVKARTRRRSADQRKPLIRRSCCTLIGKGVVSTL